MTKKTKMFVWTTVAVVIAVGVAFALYLLFRTTETYTTTTKTRAETSMLTCWSTAMVENGFFDTSETRSVSQKIKIVSVESIPYKLNYLYEGAYSSGEAASKANDTLHADYNIYMGIDAEKLTPTFSVIDDMLKINIFANRDQINARSGKMFYLVGDDVANFGDYKDVDLMQIYQDKGFSCKLETK